MFVISESALVSGVQTQLDETATVVNGTLAAFSAPATIVIGSCTVSGDLGCGLTSGTIGSSLQLGDPGLGLNAQTPLLPPYGYCCGAGDDSTPCCPHP